VIGEHHKRDTPSRSRRFFGAEDAAVKSRIRHWSWLLALCLGTGTAPAQAQQGYKFFEGDVFDDSQQTGVMDEWDGQTVNGYLDQNNIFTIVLGGGQSCGRTYLLRAFIATGADTHQGLLWLCTTERLKKKCPNAGEHFQVECSVTLSPASDGRISVSVSYPKQFWSSLRCAQAKAEVGNLNIEMLLKPKTPPSEEPKDVGGLHKKFDCYRDNAWNTFMPRISGKKHLTVPGC
jgi:hypothetical protein